MTLRTITFDDSIYKLVPLEPTDEMRFQTTHVRNDIEDETILEMLRVAIAAAPEYQQVEMPEDLQQDWKGMDGAIAFHLIDRHADSWGDVGQMMDAWLKANQDTKKDEL